MGGAAAAEANSAPGSEMAGVPHSVMSIMPCETPTPCPVRLAVPLNVVTVRPCASTARMLRMSMRTLRRTRRPGDPYFDR